MKDRAFQDRPHLLVCDDSPIERQALAAYLRRFNFAVDEVDGGAAAITAINARPFDLLILDLHMPGIDGFAVLRYLQQRPMKPPVILLSGLPPDQIQQAMYDVVGNEAPPLMLKPVDLDDLLQMLDERFPNRQRDGGRS